MDWPAKVQAIAGVLSLLSLLFGFVLVVWQLSLLKRTLRSDTNARLSEQSLAILAYMADRPHLYDYLYASKPLGESDECRVQVLCLCEMVANYSGLVVSIMDDLDADVRARWRSFITDTLASSPALRDFIQKYRSWYPSQLVDLLKLATRAGAEGDRGRA
jgi:hypothetical protein